MLAHGAIRQAVAKVGPRNVYFCVFRANREILDLMGVIPPENVLTVRHTRFLLFLIDTVRFLINVRRMKIDATVDMEFFARAPAILAYLTGAQRRVGLHQFTTEAPYRGDLMTHRVQYNPYLHVSRAYRVLVEALGHDPEEIPLLKLPCHPVEESVPTFEPTADETAKVWEILSSCGTEKLKPQLVILNPKPGDLLPLRSWPTERFTELGKRILSEFDDVTLIVTGLPSEKDIAKEICSAMGSPRVICVAGVLSLRQLMVLYTIADVLVTNDSGPAHFASMTHIDTIVMFGPETPKLYSPLGGHSHCIWSEIACSPCLSALNHRTSACRNNVCMQVITVDEVFEKVQSYLANRRIQAASSATSHGGNVTESNLGGTAAPNQNTQP